MSAGAPRARLRSPEPIGVGTGGVESMTSYIARLAERLRVPVSSLMAVLGGEGPIVGDADWIGARGHAINGCREVAERTVSAVGRATIRPALGALTLRRFAEVLPDWELLRPTLAWCPSCLGKRRYERLAWSLQLVRACVEHSVALVTECPECGRAQPPLTAYTVVGCCRFCSADLAGASGAPAPSDWDVACAMEAEGLLSATAGEPLGRHGVLPSLLAAAGHADLTLTGLVTRAGMSRSAGTAYRGGTLPSLEAWTRMAIAARASLRSLLEGSVSSGSTRPRVPTSPWGGKRARDWGLICAALEEAVSAQSEVSLRGLANALGVTEAEIRERLPELGAAVVSARLDAVSGRASQRMSQAVAEVERVVAELTDASLPASRRQVEARLGGGLLLREDPLGQAWRARP